VTESSSALQRNDFGNRILSRSSGTIPDFLLLRQLFATFAGPCMMAQSGTVASEVYSSDVRTAQ